MFPNAPEKTKADFKESAKTNATISQNARNLAIGKSDYKAILDDKCFLVDKTDFIKDIIDNLALAKIILRPRRFGKTTNLSMLKYFFEKTDKPNENAYLFHDKAIWKAGIKYQNEQGRYPLIFMSLKGINTTTFEESKLELQYLMSEIYKKFHSILFETILKDDPDEQKDFLKIINREAGISLFKRSLKYLIEYLYKVSP